ncbi:MAG TPA: glycine--tRNA ligase subunit beta [Geminicoccus sp.]|uniref:glycine--tRNA ligase subunit beta n=1 Tax=Geminicoccus sp. TaxID=2024832 RepID=UPI002E3039A4|nr:glycine--tRNA ligase subunit beta [Geminicoccus sp.]HEX2526840.1 glycine--tRNA ligase subunit beta [Geminicoccus sp.]
MAELLLELLSEEIPARMQDQARLDLARLVGDGLAAADLAPTSMRTFATPRRLVLVADGLPEQQPDRTLERRGPRVDAPAQARDGFFKSLNGLSYRLEERDEGKKGRVLYALVALTGARASVVVGELIEGVLGRFPWPKSMRWGSGDVRWVRPLQSMVCLLGGETVPVRFGDLVAGRTSHGHRFMAPQPLDVNGFDDLSEKLLAAKVMLDQDQRRTAILAQARSLADQAGVILGDDPSLVEELKGLVEWPVALSGRIDRDFMELPSEVLVTSMREHQKYLSTRQADGTLADRFITVANRETDDGGAAVIAGNERVLRARLWDARFFWGKDREVRLEDRLPQLQRMVFHADLGTLEAKVLRLVGLIASLAPAVPSLDLAAAERAALLAKCDLVTGMVGEFPELQGTMGGHYARLQGESADVADGVAEHYAPKGPDDHCPSAPVPVAVALADKIDTLVGFFAAGIRPSGSKDPFALRRAALGVIRLIVENQLRLPLKKIFGASLSLYGDRFRQLDPDVLSRELVGFFIDRLQVQQRARGTRHDLIAAVVAAAGDDDDLVRILARVQALQVLLATEDGINLVAAWRRAVNIVRIEEKKDQAAYEGRPDPALLIDPAEQALAAALQEAGQQIEEALQVEDYGAAMAALAVLRPVLDEFFDKVLVNVDQPELRRNRLHLLSTIRTALGAVADFGKVEDAPAQPGKA